MTSKPRPIAGKQKMTSDRQLVARKKRAATRKGQHVAHKKPPFSTAKGSATTRRRGKEWNLLLYVAGQSPRSLTAIDNLRKLCDQNLKGRYRIEVIDLLVNPQRSRDDQIVALPTLVRRLPVPIRKIIGDLSDTMRTLVLLQVRANDEPLVPAA
jgi:circadian clock protein KaiB